MSYGMDFREICGGIQRLAYQDWDRRFFDALIPLPDGTSYNAYLIKGSDKTALIDTVDPKAERVFMETLTKIRRLDYLVSLHAEQDHSGCIPMVLERFPEAKLVCSVKAQKMLKDLLPIREKDFLTVADGEQLSLGDKTLTFIYTPWVHWPETMVAYSEPDRILFSCDFFGSHLASTDIFVEDESRTLEAAKRYYAEIMMPFRNVIKKNLTKLTPFDIAMIAPSHGPVYPRPRLIMDAHKKWVADTPENKVTLAYISMHESTERMVNHLMDRLVMSGIKVDLFNMLVTDIGQLAMSLVDAATMVLGTPTVLTGPHPLIAYSAILANALRPKTKWISIIGSYGWGGKTVDILKNFLAHLNTEMLDPVFIRGVPKDDDLESLNELARTIHSRHQSIATR